MAMFVYHRVYQLYQLYQQSTILHAELEKHDASSWVEWIFLLDELRYPPSLLQVKQMMENKEIESLMKIMAFDASKEYDTRPMWSMRLFAKLVTPIAWVYGRYTMI